MIRGVYKSNSDDLEGTITLLPKDATTGCINLNMKLAITEEIRRIQFVFTEKIVVDKIAKTKIQFVNPDPNNNSMFDHNQKIVDKMVNEKFRYTYPVEIVSALKKIN